jgi:hypothetical protein
MGNGKHERDANHVHDRARRAEGKPEAFDAECVHGNLLDLTGVNECGVSLHEFHEDHRHVVVSWPVAAKYREQVPDLLDRAFHRQLLEFRQQRRRRRATEHFPARAARFADSVGGHEQSVPFCQVDGNFVPLGIFLRIVIDLRSGLAASRLARFAIIMPPESVDRNSADGIIGPCLLDAAWSQKERSTRINCIAAANARSVQVAVAFPSKVDAAASSDSASSQNSTPSPPGQPAACQL